MAYQFVKKKNLKNFHTSPDKKIFPLELQQI